MSKFYGETCMQKKLRGDKNFCHHLLIQKMYVIVQLKRLFVMLATEQS